MSGGDVLEMGLLSRRGRRGLRDVGGVEGGDE